MTDFSPWKLLGDFTAWVLIIGLTTLVVAAVVLMVMTAIQMHHDRKTDNELRRVVHTKREQTKRNHPSNQPPIHPEDKED